MDAAETSPLRRLLVRGAATLLALAGLFPLSYGPAVFVAYKSSSMYPYIVEFYDPMVQAIAGTPLDQHLNAYSEWWMRLAGWKPYENPDPAARYTE